jgi:hypothetical protein
VVAVLCVVFAGWLFTPAWADQRGPDSKDFYAVATLSARGGNPYDPAQLGAEEDRLYNRGGAVRVGDPGYYAFNPYGYPPLVTSALRLAEGVGPDAFYLGSAILLLAAGVAGFELLLATLHWRRRWLARLLFLASTPMALSVFTGNPSPILLLAWAGALWLMQRGRPVLGGAVLSVCLLKPPVGLPVAAALLLVGPGRRPVATAGFAGGAIAWAAASVALGGVEAHLRWIEVLVGYGGGLGPGARASAFSQLGLVGVPALLMDHVPTVVAVGAVGAVLGALVAWAWRAPGMQPAVKGERWVALALLVAAGLALTPYVHLNDLVLEAFPVLVLASSRLDIAGRLTLLGAALGAPLRIALSLVTSVFLGSAPGTGSTPGWGVALTAMLVVCLVLVARRPGAAVSP